MLLLQTDAKANIPQASGEHKNSFILKLQKLEGVIIIVSFLALINFRYLHFRFLISMYLQHAREVILTE